MSIQLHAYAIINGDGIIARFQDDDTVSEGETALPVVADPDPAVGPGERIGSPSYEVLNDRVRAYRLPRLAEPHEVVKITFAQLLIGLVAEGWITEAEGDGWLAGVLPAPVIALISTLPVEARFPAKARAIRPSEVIRNDPLVEMLGAYQGKTPAQLDQFFATSSAY